ncbi:hypothetical protein Q7C36_018325 [Tachysurus vachellii]|uniref:Uncharacterized protein n=1 Tax=Tachysurus vachellii TaxID=175792 RepID=A0AA88SCR5_TACVA|nr:hypothetical protein Q7C36_018325 [Tachysurus vachellii]
MQARSGLSPHGSVASRPVHAKMVLLLYVNEAGHATRATQRPSFFVRMRFGEEGESEFVFHSANFASRHERTRWGLMLASASFMQNLDYFSVLWELTLGNLVFSSNPKKCAIHSVCVCVIVHCDVLVAYLGCPLG